MSTSWRGLEQAGDGMSKRMEHHYGLLKAKDPCPKCNMGKGLREANVLELGWTGWENYEFLHCDICGAYYVGKEADFVYLRYAQSPFSE